MTPLQSACDDAVPLEHVSSLRLMLCSATSSLLLVDLRLHAVELGAINRTPYFLLQVEWSLPVASPCLAMGIMMTMIHVKKESK